MISQYTWFFPMRDESTRRRHAFHSWTKSRQDVYPTAYQVATTDLATLKTAGLSGRKAEYGACSYWTCHVCYHSPMTWIRSSGPSDEICRWPTHQPKVACRERRGAVQASDCSLRNWQSTSGIYFLQSPSDDPLLLQWTGKLTFFVIVMIA